MEDPAVAQFQQTLKRGCDAFNEGNQPEALNLFERAISLAGQIKDKNDRRDHMSQAALLLVRGGLASMGATLARKAIELGESGNPRQLGQDMLTLGWAQMQLGELVDARTTFVRAQGIAEKNGDYDTAAGALTNQAIIIGARKQYDRACVDEGIGLLRKSLDYLERRKNDEFEIITRIALVQALEAGQEDPDSIFPVARALLDRFAKVLRKDQWDGTLGPLGQSVQRYLRAHPLTDPDQWKRSHFPELLPQKAAQRNR